MNSSIAIRKISQPIIPAIQKKTHSSCKLVIFDMDQTLFDETLYKDIPEILETLSNKKYKMAIASYNPYASFLCERYSITKYFDIICGYYSPSGKIKHIKEIFNFYKKNGMKIKESDVIFYDDDPVNIKDIKTKTKINCIWVPPGGITLNQIQNISYI